jgi:hypothetical protein
MRVTQILPKNYGRKEQMSNRSIILQQIMYLPKVLAEENLAKGDLNVTKHFLLVQSKFSTKTVLSLGVRGFQLV